jgi:hypothetical protein
MPLLPPIPRRNQLGNILRRADPFRLQGFNLLWPAMSRRVQLEVSFVTSRRRPIAVKIRPTTPKAQRIGPLTYFWFGRTSKKISF